jgi:hypothetical protein
MLDLTIESLFVKENFDVDFAAEKGSPYIYTLFDIIYNKINLLLGLNGIISKIVAEYKKGRNLEVIYSKNSITYIVM